MKRARRTLLAACGTNAIPAVVFTMRHGWRTRGKAYFPVVLARLGEPARAALWVAFDNAEDSLARESYNGALIVAFGDISRLPAMLTDLKSYAQDTSVRWLDIDLRGMLPPKAPLPCLDNGLLNPAFERGLDEHKSERLRGSFQDSLAHPTETP